MNLEQLSGVLMGLGSPHEYFVQYLPGGDRVFHYTDLSALGSIAASHDLWLTDSRFSNDSDEMEHGLNVIKRAIANRGRRKSTSADERDFLKEVQAKVDAVAQRSVYVSCFCLKDDLLGQWRGYALGGAGVSISLLTNGFWDVAGPDGAPNEVGLTYLWRVFYETAKQSEIVDDCLSLVWDGSLSGDDQVELAVDALRFFVPTFKNAAFSDEQEARLVFVPTDTCPVNPRFRMSRGMLVPYFSLQELAKAAGQDAWRLPIDGVTVGPSAMQREHMLSVRLLLAATGYVGARVDPSITPFRG